MSEELNSVEAVAITPWDIAQAERHYPPSCWQRTAIMDLAQFVAEVRLASLPAASEGERASLRLERENNLAKEMEHREGIAANLRRALHKLEDRFGTLPLAPALCLLEQLSPQISGAQCPAPSDQDKRLSGELADALEDARNNGFGEAFFRTHVDELLTHARQTTPAVSGEPT